MRNKQMITKIKGACFGGSRRSRIYPDYFVAEERPITKNQKETLIQLVYSRISNPEEIERRLTEIESYSFEDACEAIKDYMFAPYR